MASLYGVSADRKDLWSHVDKALATSLAKVADDDLDAFVSLCLESVGADAGEAGRCDALAAMVGDWAARPAEWRYALLDYLRAHRYAVIVHGRSRWELVKKGEVDL